MKKKLFMLLIIPVLIAFFIIGYQFLPEEYNLILKYKNYVNANEVTINNPILSNGEVFFSEVVSEKEKKITEPIDTFIKPSGTENNTPENFNMKYQIKLESGDDTFSSNVSMNGTENYSGVKGISTFRGNNYRDSASYGTVDVTENKLTKIWTNRIGKTDGWTGVGWNGQPSIITWNEDVKIQMNIYTKFKEKENFTEVIYGALDSYIHFYDLETGEESRDKIKIASAIKGSVTMDPRGYPLLYVGQGIDTVGGKVVEIGYYIFSLITGEELCFIDGRDKFAYSNWGAFDGNPVIDGKTDTMFLPGENGVIYISKLNTNYDKLKRHNINKSKHYTL